MTRTDVINATIRATKAKSYLELGVRNTADNFDSIALPPESKTGVCIRATGPRVVRMLSGDYLADCLEHGRQFDVIFIDADHRYDGALADVQAALKVISADGVIVMHDSYPANAAEALPEKPDNGKPWCGEVWRVVCRLRTYKTIALATIPDDHGVTLLRKVRKNALALKKSAMPATYEEFSEVAGEWLNTAPAVATALRMIGIG